MLSKNHRVRLEESLELIEYCIEKGVVDHQRTLGFHLAAASMDLLNLFLHHHGFTTTSEDLNHNWFRSERRALEKVPHEFENKSRIVELLLAIEAKRDPLCYGVPRTEDEAEAAVREFRELETLLRVEEV